MRLQKVDSQTTVELNYKSVRMIHRKSPNTWKLNSILLNNSGVKEKVTKEIRKYFELNKNKTRTY